MRKFCFLTLLFSFFFFSCAMNQESGGSVTITMPEKTDAVRAITDVETSYTVTISGPTSVEPKNARAGETIQFSELASGNYSVKVEAFRKTKDSAPVKFAEGNENAVVEPEKETTVIIIMKAIKTDIDIDDFDEIDDAEKVDDTVDESNTEEKTEDKKDDADGTKTDAVETGKDQETKTEVEKEPETNPEPDKGLFVKLASIEDKTFIDENNKPCILPDIQGEQKELLCVKYDGKEVEKDKFNIEIKEGAWANLGTLKLMVIYAPTNESTEFEVTVKGILKPTNVSINNKMITKETGASYDFQLKSDEYTLDSGEKIDPRLYPKAKMVVRVFEYSAKESDKYKVCLNEKEFTEFEFNSGRVDGVLSYDDITLDSDNKRVITTPGNYDLSVTVYQYISNADYEKYFIPGFFEAKESISIGE